MIWADRIAKELKGKPQHIDDMFTPSGFAHIGSLRGPLLHDVMYKVLKNQGERVVFTYVFNDFDPIDGLPVELEKDFSKYFGYPLRLVPSPDGKKRSFADYFADDFKSILNELGCEAKYLSSWDMYHEGRFNDVIKEALNNAEKIQEIYQRVSGSQKKTTGWYPFQVVCPECQKIGTTKVTNWDGKEVTFSCEKNLVTWAEGCGYKGKMSPYNGNGKLPWKVDWPAHWKVLGVTFEGAGKDHASRGGSYDIAFALCEEVFHYPKPYYFPYEHFLLGGRKMSSSKGIGLRARDLIRILPPELGRFLMVRVIPDRALEFDPYGNTIPALFDEFDRCAKAYWEKTNEDLARIFELSQVNNWYQKKINLPRFSSLERYVRFNNETAYKKFEESFGKRLTKYESMIFASRLSYYKVWSKTYSQKAKKETITLNQMQKNYLKKLALEIADVRDPSVLQEKIFTLAKKENIPLREAFTAIYISLIDKPFGPKAGELIVSLDRNEVIEKFNKNSK